MESRKTNAPLSLNPTYSGALPAPGVHRRSTPSCFPLTVFAGFGRAGCYNSGLILTQNWHCQSLSAHCERDGTEQAAAMAQSHPGQPMPRLDAGAARQPCSSWQPGGPAAASARAPGSGTSLCKLGGALIVTLSLSKAGLCLVGRWSRLQLCSHLPSQRCRGAAQAMLGRKDGSPVCGDRGEAVPSLQGEMQVPVGLLILTMGIHKGSQISTSFGKSKQAALT